MIYPSDSHNVNKKEHGKDYKYKKKGLDISQPLKPGKKYGSVHK